MCVITKIFALLHHEFLNRFSPHPSLLHPNQFLSSLGWYSFLLNFLKPSLGNILYDLETNTLSGFTTETADWILSSYVTAGVKFYNCGGNYILGGYNVLGGATGQYIQRTYSSLPTHNQIYLQMRFYQIDSWDQLVNGPDYFSISIDGTSFTGWSLSFEYPGAYSLCGDPNLGFEDFVFTISLAYPHSASSLTLRMITGTNQLSSDESFGFRDIKIEFLTVSTPYFSLCAPGAPSSYLSASRCPTSCTTSGNSIQPAGYGFCSSPSCSISCKRCSDTATKCTLCETGSYLVGTTCYSACNYPLSTKTLGGVIYCETPCPGQYVWWDQSCSPSCAYTTTYGSYAVVGATTNTFSECTYPCGINQYLYWNTSCLSSCPSPLISTTYKGRKFCEYPCGASQYLYWNGSCINSCPSPLSPEIQGTSQQRNFCWYSCQPSEYLYWNGSCLSTCPSPLSPETQGTIQQRNFCWFGCQPTEYLYWNQSCSSRCPIPLVKYNLSGNLFCFLPCDMPNIYWYEDFFCRKECNFPYNLIYRDSVYQCLKPCPRPSEWFYDLEKKCSDTCELPYERQLINGIKVCHITASTLASELELIESLSGLLEPLGKVTSAIIKTVLIPELSSARSPLLVQLSTIVQYIRYIRINYPWRLRLLFAANGHKLISLNIDFSIPNWVQDKLDDYPLPDVFEKYDLDSNFINNLWDFMGTALLLILSLFILLLLRKLLSKHRKVCHIITRILQSLRWNTLLAMICADCGDIILYSSLHIRNTPLDSTTAIISLIIILLVLIFIAVILGICLKILRDFHLHQQKRTPAKGQDWLEKWKGYEILYDEIEQDSLFSLAYMAIYIIKTILFFAIIANLYEYPFLQSVLLNAINLLIFGYLLYYKPLKNRVNIIQLFINEIIGDIELICVLALAQMDKEGTDDPYARFDLGNIIIVIIVTFYVLGVVFLVIEGILFFIRAYKTWKEMRAQGIKNPFKMIKALLFGELDKVPPLEPTLDLSQNSSMLNLNTITPTAHFQNNYFQKPHSKSIIHPGSEIIKARRPRIMSNIPARPSPKRITKISAQNIEPEIQVSAPNRMMARKPKNKIRTYETIQEEIMRNKNGNQKQSQNRIRSRNRNPSRFILQNFDPSLPPNMNLPQNRGRSNTQIPHSNPPVHELFWLNK